MPRLVDRSGGRGTSSTPMTPQARLQPVPPVWRDPVNLPLAQARASHDEARAPWIGGRLPSGLGSALAATTAALAAAALYNSYHTRQVERRHPPTGRFIDVDDVRLHYLEQDGGTPVVLIHGNVMGKLAAQAQRL